MAGADRIGARLATAVLLAEGYCSLAVEMIALRVLVPVAGQSVGVTSIVVTAFLAALALGYRDGGRRRGPTAERVARNLAGAAAWSAFWLSRFGVELAFAATTGLPTLFQVAVYATVGVAPAAYLLAQTVVLLVACQRGEEASGKAGAAFSASTLGNVAGGLLTALVVMQSLGVAAAVLSAAGALTVASLVVSRRPDWRVWAAGLVAGTVGGANLAVERSGYMLATAHADYAVEEDADGVRHLRVNGQNASREDGAGIGHPYLERIEDAVYGNAPAGRPARVLVIGAGGFTFGRGRPENAAEIVFVDVDGRLPEVADGFLAPLPRSVSYAAMDGRAYLLRREADYDAVVLDAFTERTTMPVHLHTREFFALVRSRLAEKGGTLYMNMIVPPAPDRLSVRVDRTLRSVFAWCTAEDVVEASGWGNRVYACRRHLLDGDATVYTDGTARGELDGLPGR